MYAILVFSIIMGLYMMGYKPTYTHYVEQQQDMSIQGNNSTYEYNTTNGSMDKQKNMAQTLINAILDTLKDPKILLPMVGVAFASFVTAGGTRYALTFIIPAIILIAILNVFVLPMDFIYNSDIPFLIQIFVSGFLNLLLMMAIIEFITGRR